MSHPSNEMTKDILLLFAGVVNAALPSWVKLIPEVLPMLEGSLRVMVAIATIGFLLARALYYRRKTKLLTRNNNKDDE